MPLYLSLDQSTSATKALLFAADGSVLDKESLEHTQHYPKPGWVEHDASEIWSNTREVLRRLLARNEGRVGEIAFLSITNQRETCLVFDPKTGIPLHHALVWQCRRGDDNCKAQAAAGREAAIHAKTGLKLDAYFSGSKLQWLVQHQPGLRERLEQGTAVAATIDAYLVHRLTEGKVFATDHTNASRTLLFDINTLRWDEELCAWWQVPLQALPEVRESTACFGETTLDGLLHRPIPIRGVMGDSQASLFAQRCYKPGMAKVTLGTGSSLLLNIGSKPRLSKKGVVTALAWVHAGQPVYAFEGIIISSASTLSWLKDQLGVLQHFAEIEPICAALEDSGGVYLVPAFSGLGLPHWKPEARAAIVGLSSHSDRRHVIRAALESISFQIGDALDAMREEAGVSLARLEADGGPSANKVLMQFTADMTGTEISVAPVAECSPLGATLAGMLGAGVLPSLDAIAAQPRQAVTYMPQMSAAKKKERHDGWTRAVRQVSV